MDTQAEDLFLFDVNSYQEQNTDQKSLINAAVNSNPHDEDQGTPLETTLQIQSIPEAVIQNVVISVNLCTELDLRLIAISARNAEYNPVKINAVILRLRNPRCTGLLFRSGRIMVTGAKSLYDAKVGAKKMAKLCVRVGHSRVRFFGLRVENLIASADTGFSIRLEGLAHDHSNSCSYEPELFAGLIYRYWLDNVKAVLLIFVSGKIVFTGCQSTATIATVLKNVFPILAQYQK